MAFRGTYDHTLDAKNRLTVPVNFRRYLGEGAVVSKGLETCVSVWTPDGFESWLATMLGALGGVTMEAREFERRQSASAFETELDTAGRIMLPARLIEYAGLEREVSVIGSGAALEIWNRSTWDEYDSQDPATFPVITNSIGADA